MADGQIADIANASQGVVTADQVLASVAGKTGSECAMYAGLGAILADAPAERIEHFERFALEYGLANQFVSHVGELFSGAESRDLANGTRTLPIVWLLETLGEPSRGDFLETLEAAKSDRLAAGRVREIIVASSVLRRSVLQIMIHIEKARSALTRAQPAGPAAALLAAFIDDLSVPAG